MNGINPSSLLSKWIENWCLQAKLKAIKQTMKYTPYQRCCSVELTKCWQHHPTPAPSNRTRLGLTVYQSTQTDPPSVLSQRYALYNSQTPGVTLTIWHSDVQLLPVNILANLCQHAECVYQSQMSTLPNKAKNLSLEKVWRLGTKVWRLLNIHKRHNLRIFSFSMQYITHSFLFQALHQMVPHTLCL